jgi:thymidylate kinase
MLLQESFSFLVSFEGLDAVGKTTLATKLLAHMTSVNVLARMFPEFSDSPIGELLADSIRKYNFVKLHPSLETPFSETLLLMADQSAKTETLPMLEHPSPIVIADRYSDSLIAYQLPRILRSNPRLASHQVQIFLEGWINTLFREPDLTFLIHAPLELVLERVQLRDSYKPTAQDIEFFKHADSIYTSLATRKNKRFVKLDGTKEIQELLTEIIETVTRKLAKLGTITQT